MITIPFKNDEKLYIQIYDYFVDEIKKGRIKSGEKLPSRRNLASHLGVSINTVKAAYDQLFDEGYIISKERSGYYVDKIIIRDFKIKNTYSDKLPPKKEKKYKYDLKYSRIDKTKMPLTLLKNCSEYAVIKAIDDDYTYSRGLSDLRVQIAGYLFERRGVNTSWKNIIITSSFYQNLSIINSLIDKPIYALENPGYITLDKIINSLGKKSIKIPIDKYGFSVKDLEKTNANVVITTPNHQFPTGIIMGIRRRQRLLNWAEDEKNRYIIEDDYNSDFKYQGMPIPALKSLDKSSRVILSGSFSQLIGKFLSLSYLVLPTPLIEKLEKNPIYIEGVSLIQQYIVEKFMKDGDFEKHLNRMNTHYKKKRHIVIRDLSKREGIKILGSDAGFHIIISMDEIIYDMKNFDKIMSENDIYIEKVSKYSYTPYPENQIIVGFGGVEIDRLEICLDKIFRLLRKK